MAFDIDLNFKKNIENDIGNHVGERAVQNELRNIAIIANNQKLFNLLWGFGIRHRLHEPPTYSNLETIRTLLEDELNNLPSIVNAYTQFKLSKSKKTLTIKFFYTLKGNTTESKSFETIMDLTRSDERN